MLQRLTILPAMQPVIIKACRGPLTSNGKFPQSCNRQDRSQAAFRYLFETVYIFGVMRLDRGQFHMAKIILPITS